MYVIAGAELFYYTDYSITEDDTVILNQSSCYKRSSFGGSDSVSITGLRVESFLFYKSLLSWAMRTCGHEE